MQIKTVILVICVCWKNTKLLTGYPVGTLPLDPHLMYYSGAVGSQTLWHLLRPNLLSVLSDLRLIVQNNFDACNVLTIILWHNWYKSNLQTTCGCCRIHATMWVVGLL